jgi:hypothetical protein
MRALVSRNSNRESTACCSRASGSAVLPRQKSYIALQICAIIQSTIKAIEPDRDDILPVKGKAHRNICPALRGCAKTPFGYIFACGTTGENSSDQGSEAWT